MSPAPGDLRVLRVLKGVTFAYLADHLGIHPSTLQAIENGELTAMPELLAAWEQVLIDAPAPRPWWRAWRRAIEEKEI